MSVLTFNLPSGSFLNRYLEKKQGRALFNVAALLVLFTVFYNVAEGIVSVWFGAGEETLSLFGFGLDSFVEVLSGIGVAHLLYRSREMPAAQRDGFERTALRITGTGFYLLAAGLTAGSLYNLIMGHTPESGIPGIIISIISLVLMFLLMNAKRITGELMKSDALIADASCTKTCFYLSAILLFSSLVFELTGFGFIDSLGSLGIAWYAYKEGKEAFDKAKSGVLKCTCH